MGLPGGEAGVTPHACVDVGVASMPTYGPNRTEPSQYKLERSHRQSPHLSKGTTFNAPNRHLFIRSTAQSATLTFNAQRLLGFSERRSDEIKLNTI